MADEREDPIHIERRIRERAYDMWEREGRPEGRTDQYWLRAEEMIRNESKAGYAPAQSRRHRN
jgi:hypothetical protein